MTNTKHPGHHTAQRCELLLRGGEESPLGLTQKPCTSPPAHVTRVCSSLLSRNCKKWEDQLWMSSQVTVGHQGPEQFQNALCDGNSQGAEAEPGVTVLIFATMNINKIQNNIWKDKCTKEMHNLVLARWLLILWAVKSKNCFLKLLQLSGKFACIPSWSEVSGNISGTCIGISWYSKSLFQGVFWGFCLLFFVLFYSMIYLGLSVQLDRIGVSDCFLPPCPSLSN